MATSASFNAGGLASGIDTNSIVDQLVALQSRSIDKVRTRQAALRTESSGFAALAGGLAQLRSAASALQTGGLRATTATSTHTAFSARTANGSAPGRYSVEVTTLAQAARQRSASFASTDAPVTGGTLHLEVQGAAYDVAMTDGMSLSDVAKAIVATGAQVSATVIQSNSGAYLSVTNLNTGHAVGGAPSDALQLTETSTGTAGTPLGFTVSRPAANASIQVDGLSFSRASNTIADVVPGVTLTLRAPSSAPEELVVEDDAAATLSRVQAFVGAFNSLRATLATQMATGSNGQNRGPLAGDATAQNLGAALDRLAGAVVPGLTGVRTLSDLGVRTGRDGTVSVDEVQLKKGLASSPDAAGRLFSETDTGLGDLVGKLADTWSRPGTGLLALRQQGITTTLRRMDDDAVRLQARTESYRQQLLGRFAAMENVVSGLRNVGTFLTQNQYLFTGKDKT